jgi:deoxyribodipyrimidine photolyase-related protein
MAAGIWILGDQLWLRHEALRCFDAERSQTPVIFIESLHYAQERPYHAQKLVLVWSAMRHFAEDLRQQGWPVTYVTAERFDASLRTWLTEHTVTDLHLQEPNDRPFRHFIEALQLPCSLHWLPNSLFLWSAESFASWATSQKRLLLENFYRDSRRRFQVLMVGDRPEGERWNFDSENRKPPKTGLTPPKPVWFEPDALTQAVIKQVQSLPGERFGHLEPFRWGVTRQQALQVLEHFLQVGLPQFGPYQDAMLTGQATLWHSLLSPYLNLGLLHPLEVVQAAVQAYHEHNLDLKGVEGFIRQILGWREFMHGLYVHFGSTYGDRNWFRHTHPLPSFYWSAETSMNCLRQTLTQLQRTGYAHHIQRLMILSNFALIAGILPQAVEAWFHAAFIDGYDWVMQTNVIGMGLFADGGMLASKPYAASANYINRMSDYCRQCVYSPRDRTGESACPFNFFYWNFLIQHRQQLQTQGRMALVLSHLDRMDAEEQVAIQSKAEHWHLSL